MIGRNLSSLNRDEFEPNNKSKKGANADPRNFTAHLRAHLQMAFERNITSTHENKKMKAFNCEKPQSDDKIPPELISSS
jgi:hypothetical protein